MEHRDSPEMEQEKQAEPRPSRGRRFSRLVESPVSRKVALPRLIVAVAISLGLTGLAGFGISKLVQFGASWVDQRPEHQIRFADIELVPSPDSWLKGGKNRILDEVRDGAKLGEKVSRLDLDLKELQKDFKRCVWVKDVVRLDRSKHGRLIVTLVYRKPVAVISLPRTKPLTYVLDDEAVVLPDGRMDWALNDSPYIVKGMTLPLIEIEGIDSNSPTQRFGLPWKRKGKDGLSDEPDPMVLRAARLAGFLQGKTLALKSPADAPTFRSIHLPNKPEEPFFLIDSRKKMVCWGKAPGDERTGDSSPEARWESLLEWVKDHGLLLPDKPYYLNLRGPKASPQMSAPASQD
jgi:hypothetical protein